MAKRVSAYQVPATLERRYVAATALERHNVVRKGFKTADFVRVVDSFAARRKGELLKALSISAKTLDRKANGVLSPEHSNTALMVLEAKAKAQEVLGSPDLANEWLFSPALALEKRRPIDLLNSTPGAQAVMDLLDRMEHGVYA